MEEMDSGNQSQRHKKGPELRRERVKVTLGVGRGRGSTGVLQEGELAGGL